MKKIPKIIHYVWLGGNEYSKIIKRCMKSWEKHLPEYQFMLWDESNFDVNAHPYTKKAYENKKFAYVSDYIRAHALYNYGGIYLDTDVLLVDNFETFLQDDCFVGFENDHYPFTAVWGCKPKHELSKKVIEMYNNTEFRYDSSDEFKFTNTRTVSDILIQEFGVIVDNSEQLLKYGTRVYPDTILCNPGSESVSIHIFTGTWLDKRHSISRKIIILAKSHLKSKKGAELYSKYISGRREVKS